MFSNLLKVFPQPPQDQNKGCNIQGNPALIVIAEAPQWQFF